MCDAVWMPTNKEDSFNESSVFMRDVCECASCKNVRVDRFIARTVIRTHYLDSIVYLLHSLLNKMYYLRCDWAAICDKNTHKTH